MKLYDTLKFKLDIEKSSDDMIGCVFMKYLSLHSLKHILKVFDSKYSKHGFRGS